MTAFQMAALESAAAIRHSVTLVVAMPREQANDALHDVAAELRNRMNIINANLEALTGVDADGALADIREAIDATCLIADALIGDVLVKS